MSGCVHFRLIPLVAALACASWANCAACQDAPPADTSDVSARPQIVVDVSEELLNRFVDTTETRVEPVRDFVLGADVFGWQQTATHTTLDVRPARDRIAADLVLRGTTFSDTVGYTPQARAYTNGWHQFEARKEIAFSGDYLYTRRPRVSVAPSLHTRAICPMGGGIPLIGPFIINMAFQQAEARRPLAESITARKIADPLRENFNREIDERLANLNRALQHEHATQPLADRLKPDVIHFASSEKFISYRAWFTPDGDVTPLPDAEDAGLSRLAVHESIISDAAARSGVSGREFVPDQAFTFLETVLRWFEEHAVPPLPPELRFVRPTGPFGQLPVKLVGEVPIEIRFLRNQLEFTLRAKVQLVPGKWSPPLLMRFVYTNEVFDDYIRSTPEARLVKPAENELGTELLIIQPIIRQQLQELLPVVHLPRTLELARDGAAATDDGPRTVRLHLERLTTGDGWLVLTVD